MIVTFIGHAFYSPTQKDKNNILDFLEKTVGDKPCVLLLGRYGGFDGYVQICCHGYRFKHPASKLILAIPYCERNYLTEDFDELVFPPIDKDAHCPPVVQIKEWMVKIADYVVANVWRYDTAKKILDIAISEHKPIFNIADI